MNSGHPEHSSPHYFLTRIHEPHHRFDTGFYFADSVAQLANVAEPCLYPCEAILDRGQPSRNVVIGTAHRLADTWDALALQYRGQVLRVPPECYGQRFQGPRAPPALRGVAVKLANRRLRDL
ncbi:MAG TPA: hypothetical protein VFO16_15525 [Pseudonocardiaceae bacterium]|nr:hypothetical protein [Pseudonocardiaceae bacterium]